MIADQGTRPGENSVTIAAWLLIKTGPLRVTTRSGPKEWNLWPYSAALGQSNVGSSIAGSLGKRLLLWGDLINCWQPDPRQ